MEGEQNVSTSGGGGSPASSRWNPTKDQISILEGLYKQGIRTPSADQIQQITGRLKTYGHIEGKNVFYWFQNHKARQRQKQKQESIAYFSRKASSFYPPPFSNGVCNPYYLPQNELGFYPQYSKVLLPAGGINRRPEGIEKMNIAGAGGAGAGGVGFESSQLGHNVRSTPRSDHINNHKSTEALTLPLFPLEPTGLQGKMPSSTLASTSAENSATPSSSSETTLNVDEGSGDQPFFDFFSGNGSWEGD